MDATANMPGIFIHTAKKSHRASRTSQVEMFRNKETQTNFRESSAQTHPWDPPYKVEPGAEDSELLKLNFLKYGHGLPLGMHQIHLIERARMKRAWEDRMPEGNSPEDADKRMRLVMAIEADEWAYREKVHS